MAIGSSITPWIVPLIAGTVLVFAISMWHVIRWSRRSNLARADAIVVPGASVWNGVPSTTLRARLDRAAAAYHEGWAPLVICSGGLSRGISESRVMRNYLIESGLPPDAVVPDDGGRNTRACMRALKLFHGGRLRRVLLVSSPYHLYRFAAEARRRGLMPIVCPARGDAVPSRAVRGFLRRQFLRETAATIWYQAAAGVERLVAVPGLHILKSAWRQIAGRTTWLLHDADAVARSGEKIAAAIKSGRPDFSDLGRVLTPASGIDWPVDGTPGDGFGLRYARLHSGVDLRASYGSTVVASAGGTVVLAESLGSYGNTVVIDHQGGLATVYAHLCGIVVSAGDRVIAGQCLGYVGMTGRSSGPHLHFEVRVHGTPVDPLVYLAAGPERVGGSAVN